MKSRTATVLFISLLFSAKTSPAAEMEVVVEDTSLTRAIEKNESLEYIKSLVEDNANVSERNGKCNATPLIFASSCGRLDVLRFLLEQNANPLDATDCGHTAFCFAKNPEIQAALEEKGTKNPHPAATADEEI